MNILKIPCKKLKFIVDKSVTINTFQTLLYIFDRKITLGYDL